MSFELEAFGSLLKIQIFGDTLSQNRICEISDTVLSFEKKYSRFIKNNFLDTLNKSGKAEIDTEFYTLVRTALVISQKTMGYFDITLTPVLENLGYGIHAEKKSLYTTGMEYINLQANSVELKNGIQLDLGGLGKGYIIDKISAKLSSWYTDFIVDFGGDIKVFGEMKKLGLEDPLRPEKLLGDIHIQNAALCASSGQKRKFGDSHHLINPKTLQSANETLCTFTLHPLTLIADIYATVLYVAPLEQAREILEQTAGLEALIVSSNGEIYTSRGFTCSLYL